jgi:hypothetical protein
MHESPSELQADCVFCFLCTNEAFFVIAVTTCVIRTDSVIPACNSFINSVSQKKLVETKLTLRPQKNARSQKTRFVTAVTFTNWRQI